MFDTSKLQGGWFLAMGAREFKSGPVSEIDQVDWDNLLELRAFTWGPKEGHEIKWVRGSLSEKPQIRDSADIHQNVTLLKKPYDEIPCETHYLDIDMKKTLEYRELKEGGIEPDEVLAIGGGKYRLPEPTPEKMEIEVYYREDEKGFYQPFDFRIVRFIGKEEK